MVSHVLSAKTSPETVTMSSVPPVVPLPSRPPFAPAARTVLALKDPGNGVSASCMMLTKELLGSQKVAFAGTVTSIDSGTATLDVTHWFTDGTADTVTVSHDTGMQMSESLVLEKGKSYLIATSGDTLSACTGSGEETAELRQLFDEAFA